LDEDYPDRPEQVPKIRKKKEKKKIFSKTGVCVGGENRFLGAKRKTNEHGVKRGRSDTI